MSAPDINRAIWAVVDGLAAERSLTPSGLAKKAGLDPSSLNPSKRHADTGQPRWLSTRAIVAVCAVCEMSMETFGRLVDAEVARQEARG